MPWKEGYWYTKGSTAWIMIVKGDTSETKNIVALDYPHCKSMGSSTWTYATVIRVIEFSGRVYKIGKIFA